MTSGAVAKLGLLPVSPESPAGCPASLPRLAWMSPSSDTAPQPPGLTALSNSLIRFALPFYTCYNIYTSYLLVGCWAVRSLLFKRGKALLLEPSYYGLNVYVPPQTLRGGAFLGGGSSGHELGALMSGTGALIRAPTELAPRSAL